MAGHSSPSRPSTTASTGKVGKAPTATAWLEFPTNAPNNNPAITLTDPTTGAPIARPTPGQSCTINATVANGGAGPSYAGLATFYAVAGELLITAASTGELPTSQLPLARAAFSCAAGASVLVASPKPSEALPGGYGILVQVEDLISDHITAPFDPTDRHVARHIYKVP